MSLVRRVHLNFYLLNTSHCKYRTSNRTFKRDVLQRFNDVRHTEELSSSFGQMMKFRSEQAKRSILIKIIPGTQIGSLYTFCAKYVNVRDVFLYYGPYGDIYALVELCTKNDAMNLKSLAQYPKGFDHIYCRSSVFLYKSNEKNTLKKAVDIYPYSTFAAPSSWDIKTEVKNKGLSKQMMSLYKMLAIRELDIRLRFYTASQLSFVFDKLFTNVFVSPFGSSINGFGQTGCDLDIVCFPVLPKMQNSNNSSFCMMTQVVSSTDRYEQKEFLEVLATLIKLCLPGVCRIKKILEARVPIIKFFNTTTNMQCDLSNTNTLALQMTECLYIYGILDNRVKPLVYTIRKWARNVKLTNETPGHWITNFALTLLIIFYLQCKKVLPPLNMAFDLKKPPKENDDCLSINVGSLVQWKKQKNGTETLETLLYGFFEYYSNFDFHTQAVCVRDGGPKVKLDNSPIFIYNPLEIHLNVSKNITLHESIRLTTVFQKTMKLLLESEQTQVIFKLVTTEGDIPNDRKAHTAEKLSQKKTNIRTSGASRKSVIK